MEVIRNYVLAGAMLGSAFLAAFAYKVTAHVVFAAELTPSSDSNVAADRELTAKTPATSRAETEGTPKSVPDKTGIKGKGKKCQLSGSYPEAIRQWCNQITAFSRDKNLDPDLIAALIWQESGGNPIAYSKSGAVGLMQVMPRDGQAASFMCQSGPCFINRPSIQELQDPEFNINYGTGMLSGLVARHGDVREALRSYGPMDVGYYYADKVLGIYQAYKR